MKTSLRRTIAPIDVAASGTSLRRVTRIYPDDAAAGRLCFVNQKRSQLRETPCVKPALRIAASGFHPHPYVRKVFNDDGCSRKNALQNVLREYVVAIPSESLFMSREVPQVLFGTFGTVGLQFPFETETSFADFTPAFLAMKMVIRGDRRAADAEVNADSLPIVNKLYVVKFQDDMKGEPSLAIHQVGSGYFVADKGNRVSGNGEGDFLPPCDTGKVGNAFLPVHRERVAVVARGQRVEAGWLTLHSFLVSVIADLTASAAFCRA